MKRLREVMGKTKPREIVEYALQVGFLRRSGRQEASILLAVDSFNAEYPENVDRSLEAETNRSSAG